MLTKAMAAVVLMGALWVAGDSLYREFGSCHRSSGCAARVQTPPDCCSTGGSCCEVTRNSILATAAVNPGCNSVLAYCTRTDQIVEGCCSEVIDGQFRCRLTGEIRDVCCCVPILD